MNPTRAQITGVVLAGGRARRMDGADKGLLPFRGRALVQYAVEALETVAGSVWINANRNVEAYDALGYRVIADETATFDGPLAGLLSALRAAPTQWVLTVPCDAPLLTGVWLARLVEAGRQTDAPLVVASDGERLHPVVLMANVQLAADLEAYLAAGERRVEDWIRRHRWVVADFSDQPDVLANLNTPDELARLEGRG